ncbi:hypothetical protein NL460_29285, partial [Klebsiella pneumoniae]|nr:hypothetical protein [Klebsiella pneumoniae]
MDILKTELSVGMMSQANMPAIVAGDFQADSSQPQAQVLTEKAIYDAILNLIQTAKASEQIDLAMFYLSERKIIKSL